jgi:hypothetical protein
MTFWWQDFGRWALVSGVLSALVLAGFLTWQRWRARQKGKVSQARLGFLFFLEFLQTAGFLTLLLALNEMVRENLMPSGLRWFLTAAAVAALVGAVGIGHFAKDRYTADELPRRKGGDDAAAGPGEKKSEA